MRLPAGAPAPPQSNFDALRLLAATVVLYGNGLVLTGASGSGLWGAPLPRIGVDLFFAISGYLLVGSWERSTGLAHYLGKRVLRAGPALVACVLATVFILGPLATRLPLRAYLLDGLTRRYLVNIALLPQLWLPGVFEGQQWSGAVNPMLWTLLPGALCALSVPAFGLLPPRLRAPALLACAVLCAAASLLIPWASPAPLAGLRATAVQMLTAIPFFMVGAFLATLERSRGEGLWRADLAVLCYAGNWMLATWVGEWNIVLEWLTLPYMAACFGRMAMPALGRLGALGNPSYGLFLYAFPVQQFIVWAMPGNPHPILTCFAIALPLGLLSWHLVERPALRWGPGLLNHGWAMLRPRASAR